MKLKPITYLLAVCAGIELLLFIWLCSLGRAPFYEFISAPDTPSYNYVALELAQNRTLVESPRTLGYPLFLAFFYFLFGFYYGSYSVIAAQLALNLFFTLMCWRLLERIAPAAGTALRTVLTLCFFWAGVGMAVYLLTDFLASFLFSVFLYGFLFWRNRPYVVLAGACLGFATLSRPTFTFIFLIIPLAAYLVGKITSRMRWSHVALFVFCSFAGTGVSVAYQYWSYEYVGPSSIVAKNIGRLLSFAATGETKREDYIAFERRIAQQAGQPYQMLSQTERQKYASQIFLHELKSQPGTILLELGETFVKYLFAPIEVFILKVAVLFEGRQAYYTYLRPVLGLICLPLWLLCLFPPKGIPRKRMYYAFMLLFLFYVAATTAINPGQGERIRFPVLLFMLPVAAWNACVIHSYMVRRRQEPGGEDFKPKPQIIIGSDFLKR